MDHNDVSMYQRTREFKNALLEYQAELDVEPGSPTNKFLAELLLTYLETQ